ncbi:MAG: TetR/AcrR family transcriptional regulator [Lysobacterales bacterium]
MSDKRIELEQAATAAVQRSGLQNLSFRTLADHVGVKSSSVHYYFPEKSDLAKALITNYTEALNQKVKAVDQQSVSLRKKLEGLVTIFAQVIEADNFCLCGMMAAEVATLTDENRQLLAQFFTTMEDWLCAALVKDQHQVNSPMHPRSLARLIISGLEGAILLDRVDGGCERLNAQREMLHHLVNDA